jgi:hypothetical protein
MFDGFRHRGCRFASADNNRAAFGRGRQIGWHASQRRCKRYGLIEKPKQECPWIEIHR